VAYVLGDELHRPGEPTLRLSERLFAPLLGQHGVPLAIGSPDRSSIAYHSWRESTPSLRVVDLRTGRDTLLARGAQSLAWGDRIAYVLGTRATWRKQTSYLGNVVVATRAGAKPSVWTTKPAQYRVIAWAGRALLVAARGCNVPPCKGQPARGVYALSRPGQLRRTSLSDVSAVSPDGRFLVGRPLTPGSDDPTPIVEVNDVGSGRTIAALDLAQAGRGRMPLSEGVPQLGQATWRGDKIIGVASHGAVSVLLVLRFDGRELHLDQALRLDREARADSKYGFFFLNPTLIGTGARRVVVQLEGELRDGGRLATTLTCDLERRSCVRGRALPPRRWLAVVANPSRPLP
jgi:hypothetical protein